MDKLKEIIGNVVMGHCDGGYIENTTDFINDLTNSIKSNQLGNPKESEQIAESEFKKIGKIIELEINNKTSDYWANIGLGSASIRFYTAYKKYIDNKQ